MSWFETPDVEEAALDFSGGKWKTSGSSQTRSDAGLERLSALALPQLAAEVMTKGFTSDYDPTYPGKEPADIADELRSRPAIHLLRDSTVRVQVRISA